MRGQIFDIKKFAIHDGPGIRTTLFLKGCPLNCVWCHNPEGIKKTVNLWYMENKCIRCRNCVSVCPLQALSINEEDKPFIQIDRKLCDNCGICVDTCPTTALTFDSSTISVETALEKLLEDREFYLQSGGGITLSGGDPLFQNEFTRELLKRCKAHQIHTAIETSMQANWSDLESLVELVDLFIVDLKLFDKELHKKYTGKENTQILSNFSRLAKTGKEMLIRIPLIPGITATEENLRSISRFVHKEAPSKSIELINFNPLAINKYRLMDIKRTMLESMRVFTESELARFYQIIEEEGVSLLNNTTHP